MANTETSFHLRKWGHGVDGCGQEDFGAGDGWIYISWLGKTERRWQSYINYGRLYVSY